MKRVAAAALLALSACSKESGSAGAGTGDLPPPLELPDLSGRPVRLADFKGKVVLLDFWATWCPPCIEELPDLIRLHKSLETGGFTVVGVAVEESSQADVSEFVRLHKVPYPVLYAEERPKAFRLRALPTAYLLDREGRVRQKYLGSKDAGDLKRDVESLLKEHG